MGTPDSIIRGVQRNLRSVYGAESYYATQYARAELLYWRYCTHWMHAHKLLAETPSLALTPKCVLDIGCAYGTLACYARKLWPDARVICIDATRYLHPYVEHSYNLEYHLCDVETSGIPSINPIDVVIATEVLEHLNFHPLSTLEKIHASMSNKGLLFISTPDAKSWPPAKRLLLEMPHARNREEHYQWEDRGHVCQYSEDELRTLLNSAGFVVERLDRSLVLKSNAIHVPDMYNINIQARKVGR